MAAAFSLLLANVGEYELEHIVNRTVVPHKRTRAALTRIAAQWTGQRLSAAGLRAPRNDLACLYAHVRPWG